MPRPEITLFKQLLTSIKAFPLVFASLIHDKSHYILQQTLSGRTRFSNVHSGMYSLTGCREFSCCLLSCRYWGLLWIYVHILPFYSLFIGLCLEMSYLCRCIWDAIKKRQSRKTRERVYSHKYKPTQKPKRLWRKKPGNSSFRWSSRFSRPSPPRWASPRAWAQYDNERENHETRRRAGIPDGRGASLLFIFERYNKILR